FMYHSWPGRIGFGLPLGKILFKVLIYKMNHIHLTVMAGGLFTRIEIFWITRTCKLGKDMQGRIIFMVSPVDSTLTPPIPPVHGPLIPLLTDRTAIALELLVGPGIVFGHSLAASWSNKAPFSSINGLGRIRNRYKMLVHRFCQSFSISGKIKPYLPASALPFP